MSDNNSKRNWLPLIVVLAVGLTLIAAVWLLQPRPSPEPEQEAPPPRVEVVPAQPRTLALPVHTQGTVAPRRQIELVSQVGGQIVEVAPNFAVGGAFTTGDWLLQVDPRDYQHALARAQARVRDAEMALASERGVARQAQREWRDLGNEDANALFLRKPQLAAAEANLEAAQAELAQAQLELERTRITAPFTGRVREKLVDLGQHIAPGTPVARIFDSTSVEIRLPLTDQQALLLDLPLPGAASPSLPAVTVSALIGGERHFWQGHISRTEAALDPQSRQFFALAEVQEPYNLTLHSAPLLVGTFVDAEIQGRPIEQVVELPRTTVFRRNLVYTLNDALSVQQKSVRILHRDEQRIWVQGDLAEGELVVLDRQNFLQPGVTVTIHAPEPDEGATGFTP